MKSRLDQPTLEHIAVETGGVFLHAARPGLGLTELYRDHIATLDERELERTLERRFDQRYQLAAGVGVPAAGPRAPRGRPPSGPDGAGCRAAAPRRRRHGAALALARLSLGWLDPQPARARATGSTTRVDSTRRRTATTRPGRRSRLATPALQPGRRALQGRQYDERWRRSRRCRRTTPIPPDGPPRLQRRQDEVPAGRGARAAGAAEDDGAVERSGRGLPRVLGRRPRRRRRQVQPRAGREEAGGARKRIEDSSSSSSNNRRSRSRTSSSRRRRRTAGASSSRPSRRPEQQGRGGRAARRAAAGGQEQAPRAPGGDASSRATSRERGGRTTSSGPARAASGKDDRSPEPATTDRATARRRESRVATRRLDREEATALLDAQRTQEVPPGEIVRRLEGARVAEAAGGLVSHGVGVLRASRSSLLARRRLARRGHGAGPRLDPPRVAAGEQSELTVEVRGRRARTCRRSPRPTASGSVRRAGDTHLHRERADQLVDHASLRGDAAARRYGHPRPHHRDGRRTDVAGRNGHPPGVGRRRGTV